jgi:hypothetical protein
MNAIWSSYGPAASSAPPTTRRPPLGVVRVPGAGVVDANAVAHSAAERFVDRNAVGAGRQVPRARCRPALAARTSALAL